jgi:hypothetical protein
MVTNFTGACVMESCTIPVTICAAAWTVRTEHRQPINILLMLLFEGKIAEKACGNFVFVHPAFKN